MSETLPLQSRNEYSEIPPSTAVAASEIPNTGFQMLLFLPPPPTAIATRSKFSLAASPVVIITVFSLRRRPGDSTAIR